MKTKPIKANGTEQSTNGGIRLDPEQAYRLGTLVADLKAAQESLNAADKAVSAFLGQCASSKGIRLEDYELRIDTMMWVRKPQVNERA